MDDTVQMHEADASSHSQSSEHFKIISFAMFVCLVLLILLPMSLCAAAEPKARHSANLGKTIRHIVLDFTTQFVSFAK